ncbi:polymeric immunoglobulin receptor-like [Sardina pilchardus]|uniref:polymeric immunoglobulin receptor-like n=1 Tax=Sardina pilchardus TaxID=27697 RepID=UPI002E116F36
MKGILFFTLCLISVPGRSAKTRKLKAYINGGILIFCQFDEQHKEKQKYLCKGENSTCPYNRLDHNDSRVLQYENARRDYLTVLITNLTSEDSGTYYCGADDGHFGDKIALHVMSGDCCDPPFVITGLKGENINIQCKYLVENRGNIKHLCKQQNNIIETDLIQSKPSEREQKYSLSDNTSANLFSVTIHELETKDAGIYWCGVRTGQGDVALISQINLQITGEIQAGKLKTLNLKGFQMGGIAILCKFNNMHTNKKRYFCKGNSTTCPHNRFTNGTDSRFFQYENEFNKAHLLVLLTNLTTQDTGMYHCAVEDEEMQAAFNLNIKEVDCCDSPNTTTGHVGGHKRIQCKYPEEAKTNVKHFFKQHDTSVDLDFITSNSLPKNTKYSQSDNKSANVFTVTIHELERKDAGIYWCGVRTAGNNVALTGQVNLQITGVTEKAPVKDMKTPVVMGIIALVLAVTLFLCYRHIQSKEHDRSNRFIYHQTENPDPDKIYEEIEDIGPPPPPLTSRCNYIKVDNAGDPTYYTIQSPPNLPDDRGLHTQINTVYATAELPGDVATYSNIESPIHTSADTRLSTGSDEADKTVSTVYATAQCPSNPTRIPTPHTDQPDPTNPVNQEPKYTNADTVCKTPHSPTHTSDDTDYSMVCSPTSTQVSTVYANAELITNTNNDTPNHSDEVPASLNNDATMSAERMPSKSIDDPAQVGNKSPCGLSSLYSIGHGTP